MQGLTSFSADKVMATCLVLHTDYHILWEFSFRQLSTLQSTLWGVFPWEWKQKTKKKQKTKRWIYGSILKISRCCFSETRENLAFYLTAWSRHVHLMFLSMFTMLLSYTETTNRVLSPYSFFSPCYLISHDTLFLFRWLTTVEALSL